MRSGLQDLAGKVASLRAEADYFLQVLGELQHLSDHEPWLSEAQEGDITRADHTYSRSASENLERATDDLRNWWAVWDGVVRAATTNVAY